VANDVITEPQSGEHRRIPAWRRVTEGEQRWAVGLAMLALITLQLLAPRAYAFQPGWLIPALELAIFVVLTIASPRRINRESAVLRMLGLGLVAIATSATAWSAVSLGYDLIYAIGPRDPAGLIRDGGAIWITNVIVFSLWYWEFDRGGPAARANNRIEYPDFLFPQMTSPETAPHNWEPEFADYLYLSFTNAASFSPTDVMPMSRWAKLAMMFQAVISLITVVLVIARAVNVLR
jgi:hypothetical protein